MSMKKAMAVCAAAVLAAALFSGCSRKKGSESAGGGKELRVFLYMNEHERAVYSKMIEEFEQKNGCKVDFQITTQAEYATALIGMMTSRDFPDVFYVGPETVREYAHNGYIADLTPLLDKAGISTGDLPQDVLNMFRYNGSVSGSGNLYALPKDASVFAYAYNKELFDEAGVAYPDPQNPYTYDEFVAVCQKLTKDTDGDGETDQWGCGFANAFMLYQFLWSNGASFLSNDCRTVAIDTPQFKDALQKFADLTLKYKVTPTVAQDASLGVYQRWLAGQEAFYACGTWDVAAFMDDDTFPFEWDLCAYPTLSTGISYTWLGTVGFCIAETSKNKDLALEFINMLSSDEQGQRSLSGMTGSASVQLPNLQSLAGEFAEMAASGKINYPKNVEVFFNYQNGTGKYAGRMMESTYTPNNEWLGYFFEGVDNVKNGSMTVDEYVKSVKPRMQEALDEAWSNIN